MTVGEAAAEAPPAPKAPVKSWRTRWATKKPAPEAEPKPEPPAPNPEDLIPPVVPPIRRLRVSLFGGDTFQPGIGKADVAAALLRGLTADYPGKVDPILDFDFSYGVFERAWGELLDDQPSPATGGDRWGMGPVGLWSVQNKMHFSPKAAGETRQAWDAYATEESASLCPGLADKMGLGEGSVCRPFRTALGAAGVEVEALAAVHQDVYTKAQLRPRELVWLKKPCAGVLATFARFAPEIGATMSNMPGSCAAILDVFEHERRPFENDMNVAMLYAAPPNGRIHKSLTPGKLLCSVQDAGSNMVRMLREYNWIARGEGAKEWERSNWRETDVRSKIEYCLSNRNLNADSYFREKVATAEDGWLDLDVVRGFPPVFMLGCATMTTNQLREKLGGSKVLDTLCSLDGRVFVRRGTGLQEKELPKPRFEEDLGADGPGGEKRRSEGDDSFEEPDAKRAATDEPESAGPRTVPPPPKSAFPPPPARLEFDWSDPNLCWDFAKGFCSRGNHCNYSHGGRGAGVGGHVPNFRLGTRVMIVGLTSGSKFNNRVGECEDFDPGSERWMVRLGDGKQLKVKESNIERC